MHFGLCSSSKSRANLPLSATITSYPLVAKWKVNSYQMTKVLSHMAEKEHKTIVEMAHELFTLGLECKLHQHKRRIAELEGKKQGIPSGDGLH